MRGTKPITGEHQMKSNESPRRLSANRNDQSELETALASNEFAHLLDGVRARANGLSPTAAAIIELGEKYRPAKREIR
jgi:hypothetical protein